MICLEISISNEYYDYVTEINVSNECLPLNLSQIIL